MVDIPARRSLCSGRARRAVAALAAAGCLAFLSFAPGAAHAAEPGDPSGWEAAPYSPLPWSNIGAIGNAVTLDFAGDDGGLTDAAGAATGFTLVQPDAAGAPAFVPDRLAVANGVLSITVPPETAAEQNLVGLGVDAEQRTLQVSVAVSGTGGRAGLWFGPRGGDRVELTVDAPAPDAPITAVLLERRGATVATSATIPVAAGGPVVLQLVVDAIAGTAVAGIRVDGAALTTVGEIAGLPLSLTDGTLLDSSTRPPESRVTAMAGVFAVGSGADAAAPVFVFDDFAVADVTVPAPPTPPVEPPPAPEPPPVEPPPAAEPPTAAEPPPPAAEPSPPNPAEPGPIPPTVAAPAPSPAPPSEPARGGPTLVVEEQQTDFDLGELEAFGFADEGEELDFERALLDLFAEWFADDPEFAGESVDESTVQDDTSAEEVDDMVAATDQSAVLLEGSRQVDYLGGNEDGALSLARSDAAPSAASVPVAAVDSDGFLGAAAVVILALAVLSAIRHARRDGHSPPSPAG